MTVLQTGQGIVLAVQIVVGVQTAVVAIVPRQERVTEVEIVVAVAPAVAEAETALGIAAPRRAAVVPEAAGEGPLVDPQEAQAAHAPAVHAGVPAWVPAGAAVVAVAVEGAGR